MPTSIPRSSAPGGARYARFAGFGYNSSTRIVAPVTRKGYRSMQREHPESITTTAETETKLPAGVRVEPDPRHVVVRFADVVIADSRRAVRVIEGERPPVFYIPPEDVKTELLHANETQTHCPLKGDAHYYDLTVGDTVSESAAWCYPEPKAGLGAIQYAIAFYPARVAACSVDGQPVTAEENPYYGGWIIS
jgi:uncharacterized protein (DUF427 family)